MNIFRLMFSVLLLLGSGVFLGTSGQSVDHWETIIYDNDDWNYMVGSSAIPMDWIENGYDASQWLSGPGGFGYGDDDDSTILEDVVSVFILKQFDVADLNVINALVLHADYDDGFVAYLNGEEIARKNLGAVGVRVPYDESTPTFVEANQTEGKLPEAIFIDPDFLLQGSNTLAIQVHNHGTESSDLSSNFFLSVGLEDDSVFFGVPPVWFDSFNFQSTLPLIKITTDENSEIEDEPRVKAHMGIIHKGPAETNSPFDEYNIYDGNISIELRGTSSLGFDKKGYGFETQNADGSNNNVALLGLPEENDWVLHGPYSDKSLLRNVLTYHLGNLTGRYAPRTRLCELFINDNYEGVYVLTEKIKQDKNRVDIAKMTEEDNNGDELTGGYIFKVDRNTQDIPGIGWTSDFPDNKFFAYVDPKADDISESQKMYLREYMSDFESAIDSPDYLSTYENYINVASLVDYFLVTEVSKHIDAFKLSFYMYKDKDSKGGKLHFGPLWDFNLGYGNFDFACSPDFQGWAYEFPDCGSWHPFWARKLLDVPNVQHLSDCRWAELREGPFRTDSLLMFIDERYAEMGEAVDRNFERWDILGEYVWPNDFVGEDYAEELNFLKTWLRNRLEWMDRNMKGECNAYVSSTAAQAHQQLILFPNPTDEVLNISSTYDKEMLVEIYSLDNKLVKVETLSSTSTKSIDISTFLPSYYILVIRAESDGQVLFVDKLVVTD